MHIDAVSAEIADGFLELNEKREQADYDHEAVFARADTRGQVRLARRIVDVIESPATDATSRFYTLIAMQARVQSR